MRNRDPNRDPRRSPVPGDRARRPRSDDWIECKCTIGMLIECFNIQENRVEMLTMLDWDKLVDHESREDRIARRGE